MTTTITDTKKVTLSDIRNAFMSEWERMHHYYDDMGRFRTAEAYADFEMSFVEICNELRDDKYFLAFENSRLSSP